MVNEMRIAVIGAGLGGLTAAAILHRRGFAVDVYEQAGGFARVGAGIQMSANAMRVLRGIGVGERIERIAFRPSYWRNRDWDTGNLRFELTLGTAAEQRHGVPYLLMHRADLHEALAASVPAEKLHFRKRLIEIDQASSGVTLKFEDGSFAEADMMVGADGVHSRVRELICGPQAPNISGRVAYRAVFPSSLLGDVAIEDCTKWWGPDRHIVIYFTKHDRSELYFVTSVPEPEWCAESWSAKGDLSQLRDTFAGFHPHVQAVLRACPEVHKWALLERDPLPAWSKDAIVLLGDSCHPMTPYMAQGAATSMEDAAVLARCLETSANVRGAFQRYEAARKERTSRVQLSSHKNEWLKDRTETDWVYDYDAWSVPLPDQAQAH
jgi:6-hydroxynicotinate 3-monooxygenase